MRQGKLAYPGEPLPRWLIGVHWGVKMEPYLERSKVLLASFAENYLNYP